MKQRIAHVAIVVADYDDAIDFYVKKVGFDLIEDTDLGDGKRWVLVRPTGAGEAATNLLLAKAGNAHQETFVGNQTGGRVGFFLYTDNIARDVQAMQNNGVEFTQQPITHPYGTVAIFADLYGNLWDLIEPS